MIVDDAAFMRATLKEILTKNDFEVVAEGVNGVDALKTFDDYKPDRVTWILLCLKWMVWKLYPR